MLVGGEKGLPDTDDGRESLGVGAKVLSEDGVFRTVGSSIVSGKGSHLPSVAK